MADSHPTSHDEEREVKMKKQKRKMSKIVTKAWNLPQADHFQESARAAKSGDSTACFDLASIGQNIDKGTYRLGLHGWEDFAKDLGGVYNRHIARDSKHARNAKSHLETVVDLLIHIHKDLGPIAVKASPPSTDLHNKKKRKSSEGVGTAEGASKKKKMAVPHKKAGESLTMEEREANAMASLESHIEELGGSRDLIEGFKPKLLPRSDGRFDLNFVDTEGKRFRSMLDVGRFFGLAKDSRMSSSKRKPTRSPGISKISNKARPSNGRELDNERRKIKRELEKLTKSRQKATKALDDFESNKKGSRYPIDDDILMEEESDSQRVTSTICPAARVPDIDGFPQVPPDCLADLIMAWDFLCTFNRALSLNPIRLDDFASALTYQPPPSETNDHGMDPSVAAPPVYVAEAHLALLKLLLQDRSSDEWWWSILETDELLPSMEDELTTDSDMVDSRAPLIKIDMAALLAEPEDPLITSSWLHVLEGVRRQKVTTTKPIRKAVRDATALVTNRWVKAYLKKSLEGWNRRTADFTKRAVLWLVDRMKEAHPDLFGQAVKPDQLQANKEKLIDESRSFMDKMGDSEMTAVAVDDDDVDAESDYDSDESDDDQLHENGHSPGASQAPGGEAVDELTAAATSSIPIRPPPTVVDLLLPPAKPNPGTDVVNSFTWPQVAGATVWRILHRYKRLRNEVDDTLRAQRELPPLTIGERRQREADVSARMLSECAATEVDTSEKASRHLSAGGPYLELSTQERLCLLRLLIEAAYDSIRVYEVVDDNFKARIGAVKALEMEKRRAKREAKEEAAAAEVVARNKLAAEARSRFFEEKRDQIEEQNKDSHEYSEDFIDGLTDDDIIEFDEETKADYEALPEPASFNKAEVNKMVVRVQEENVFNTDSISVLTMQEVIDNEALELREMEEELGAFGGVESFSMDRDTTKQIERLRRNIENMKHDAEYLPSERQDAVNALHDAVQDGTIKALRAAIRLAKHANLQGEDEETGGVWALDVLRDAALELKAAEGRKRLIDAQKDLVQKRNKCFIRTEPIGSDRFRNRFWQFGSDDAGRVWAEADFVLMNDANASFQVQPGYVKLLEPSSAICVGVAEKEADFIRPDMSQGDIDKFLRFSRQEYHKEGALPLLVKRQWGCHSTEKSLRSMMKSLDGRGTRELELKTQLKETLEESGVSTEPAQEKPVDSSTSVANRGITEELKSSGDEDVFRTAKQSVNLEEEDTVISLHLISDVKSAIGQSVRVREVIDESRDGSIAHYNLGTVDVWKMTKVDVDDADGEDGDTPMSTFVPTWRVSYERSGEVWLSGDELLDSLCRYIFWKTQDKGYTEHDAAFLAYRNSTGRHCGKASDAPLSSTPMFLARLMVKREQELYFTLKSRTLDNNWGGKSGTRNAWITTMKDYCYDFLMVRDGLLTLEQAFFELMGGTADDGSESQPDAKQILSDEKSLFGTELETIETTAEGLWNSRESRAVFREIVTFSRTTGILALALDLLCRNCRAYLDRNKMSEPRRSVAVASALPPRTSRRMNAWQRANDDWY